MDSDKVKSFKVEVIADDSGEWCSNSRRYADSEKAREAGSSLASRWLAVRKWRVEPSEDEPNA